MNLAVPLRRNDDLGAASGDPFGEMIRIVTFVGDRGIGGETVDQLMGKSDVVALSRRPDQTDRKTKSFGGSMDFGAQAATRPAKTLGIRPPLTLRAPAACW